MNGCIILFGESFRFGGQGNRNTGLAKSYNGQMEAAKSHISFIENLTSKNVLIDTYISSYETTFSNDLINAYKPNLIGHKFYKTLQGQGNLINNAIKKIELNKYKFLLIMRIDLFLKEKFIEIFNHEWDTIRWLSAGLNPSNTHNIHPRVNDMMMFFPKKYYKYLQYLNYNSTGHHQWKYFIENTNLTYKCLDTMITTRHNSNTQRECNPIYYIVNRKQSQKCFSRPLFNKWKFKCDKKSKKQREIVICPEEQTESIELLT